VPRRVWITWENQRRSIVLADHFGCDLLLCEQQGPLRYPRSVLATLAFLIRYRPRHLFVQNPSMLLAAIAVLWGMVTRAETIVDRHSTFLLGRDHERSLQLAVFRLLSRFTLRYASLTIVTNEFLATLVAQAGGRAAVLPDKLPNLVGNHSSARTMKGRSVFVVSSFADDEPLEQVVDAAALLRDSDINFYISGRKSRAPKHLLERAPSNVHFTDFLPDDEYATAMRMADIVMVLTTAEHTMLCGCYEAVAAGKPLVTSDMEELRAYFSGATFVDNTARGIAAAVHISEDELVSAVERIRENRQRIDREWAELARRVEQSIGDGDRNA
jgi:glycosyltransferase involved in cell wall biosynthesis